MNFAPLDCPCQGRFFRVEKNLPGFFILEKIAKNQKSIFLAPTAKNGFNGLELLLCLNSTDPMQ
jgi:hypothetical protein